MNMQHTGLMYNSDYIYQDLHEKIENLQYVPGERLSENELCALYGGASRHMVRGALAHLKEINFIDVFPQRGTYVSLINLRKIEAILYLREAIEQKTLDLICEREDNQDLIEKLSECVNRQRAAAEESNEAGHFYEIDDEFHKILLESVDMADVLELYSDYYASVRRWRNLEVSVHGRMDELPAEHEKIIGFIKDHDAASAREFIHYHIDTISRYRDQMKEQLPEYFV